MDATNLDVSQGGNSEAARRVLVVDDDVDFADSLGELLESSRQPWPSVAAWCWGTRSSWSRC